MSIFRWRHDHKHQFEEKLCCFNHIAIIRILALNQKSEAAYLITGDKELLVIKKFGSSKILSPRQFWEAVKQKNAI